MTQSEIDAAEPGDTLWDKGKHSVKGLHLRVSNLNQRSYYLFYRTKAGQQRRTRIADAECVFLSHARKIAREWMSKVYLGGDPALDQKRAKGGESVGALFQRMKKDHWGGPKFKESKWADEVERIYRANIHSTFDSVVIASVTVSKVKNWHISMAHSPISANRALAVLSKMFNYAQQLEWITQGINPCYLIERYPEKTRERYATKEELKTIGKILVENAAEYPHQVAFLLLLMFTGSRPEAVEQFTWDMLQIVQHGDEPPYGILRFPGKGKNEMVVIPGFVLEELESFPKEKTLTGIKMPKAFWHRVRKKAGCQDLWIRDWRRTFATIGMSAGYDMGVISEVLNHKSVQTTKVYAKLVDQARIKTSLEIAEKLRENTLVGKDSNSHDKG